jgi:peptide/nickel transport system substrate-binding protein
MGEYREAPMLAALVDSGALPPVVERLPDKPLVVTPYEEVGKYGGILRVFATNESPWNDMQTGAGISQGLTTLAPDRITVAANIVEGYEIADDQMSFTLFLRKGLKWSDGVPFNADDIAFYFDDVQNNPDVSSWNVLGKVVRTTVLDDLTIRLEMNLPEAKAVIPSGAASWRWFAFQPKHYLSKWHITHNADADKVAKDEGYDHWHEALHYHMWWAPQQDLDLPMLDPWILKETATTHKLFERNPYYWKVDTEGNQLPYIDQILSTIVDGETYNLKAISGEADLAYVGTSFENFTLYKENEDSGEYRVIMMQNGQGGVPLSVNLNHPDPVIRKLYQNVKFRQALSVALNRNEINQVVYHGLGMARNALIPPWAPYYKDEWGESFSQHDPALANRLLDEIGLNQKDSDGFRKRPDGSDLQLLIEYTGGQTKDNVLELVSEYWREVGLRVLLKNLESSLYRQRIGSPDHDLISGSIGPYGVGLGGGGNFVGKGGDFAYAFSWGAWLDAKQAQVQKEIGEGKALPLDWRTMTTHEEEPLEGEEPPDDWKQVNMWAQEISSMVLGDSGYNELAQKILDFHAENLYVISTVDIIPRPLIAKNNLKNIPPDVPEGFFEPTAFTWVSDQFFFK